MVIDVFGGLSAWLRRHRGHETAHSMLLFHVSAQYVRVRISEFDGSATGGTTTAMAKSTKRSNARSLAPGRTIADAARAKAPTLVAPLASAPQRPVAAKLAKSPRPADKPSAVPLQTKAKPAQKSPQQGGMSAKAKAGAKAAGKSTVSALSTPQTQAKPVATAGSKRATQQPVPPTPPAKAQTTLKGGGAPAKPIVQPAQTKSIPKAGGTPAKPQQHTGKAGQTAKKPANTSPNNPTTKSPTKSTSQPAVQPDQPQAAPGRAEALRTSGPAPQNSAAQPAAAHVDSKAESVAANLLDFPSTVMRAMAEGSHSWAAMISKITPNAQLPEMTASAESFQSVAQAWAARPDKLLAEQTTLVSRYVDLWQANLKRALGQAVEPVAQPEPGDHRFKDPAWSQQPILDTWKQHYLITTQWLEALIDKADGLDERTRQRADFYLRQLTSAAAPSNHPLLNPEVLRTTIASQGANLVDGLANFRRDLERSGDTLRVSQTDTAAFQVGVNVAATPGKVVFQNEIIQLLHYTPSTPSVHRVPLLIVPPWINKFYILDLQPQKSFIKFAVDQGFTVFVVSWVNPDSKLAHKTFEDYAREGIMAAADAVSRATDVHKINVLGYCVGGTLLATTLAWLAAGNENRFTSATFLAAQVDFEKAGDLLVFIDEAQLVAIEKTMAEAGGVLDGARMAQVFNMMRPRDLIWPYVVNNYMLGKKPMAFDLLYWNQDSTRMAAANHAFYLRNFYLENKLAKGGMVFGGRTLTMKAVTVPVYELATKEDHIAPAESVYRGAKLFGGPVRYVLAGSGHIAGVINPPFKPKYQYWTADGLPDSLTDWQANAQETAGSWWPDWITWLRRYSGESVAARVPGDGLAVLEDAPGNFVKVTT
jgi:polyhydroxyalkanoate synthase subunit PhaC